MFCFVFNQCTSPFRNAAAVQRKEKLWLREGRVGSTRRECKKSNL